MAFISTQEMNVLTERNLRQSIIDQRFQSATMLGIFRGKKRLKLEEGGSIISQPILSQINGTAQSYSGADVLDAAAQEEFTAYELPYKQATVSVVVTGLQREQNSGRFQSLNFVKNKQESALLALFKLLAGYVFGDGSGNNGKDWDGFLGAINNASGFANYLGIDRTANPWWQGQVFDPGVSTALSAASMMTLFMSTKTDEEVIDCISTTKGGYVQYWNLLTPGERFVDDVIGNLGFSNIAFQGKAVVEDSNNPAGTMYFWNLEHCRMIVHRNKNFIFRPFQEPDNQDVQVGRWIVYGNFENRKPGASGVYRNITNA